MIHQHWCWEVDAHGISNDTFYAYRKLKEPMLEPLVDFDVREAVPVKARSSDILM